MKQKTPLQELIVKLEGNIEEVLKHYDCKEIDKLDDFANGIITAYQKSINQAKSLLPTEREQIEEAYFEGKIFGIKEVKDYLNDKFEE